MNDIHKFPFLTEDLRKWFCHNVNNIKYQNQITKSNIEIFIKFGCILIFKERNLERLFVPSQRRVHDPWRTEHGPGRALALSHCPDGARQRQVHRSRHGLHGLCPHLLLHRSKTCTC
ncbi:unnamed protein product, partial [Nesidiocoris tenuis]